MKVNEYVIVKRYANPGFRDMNHLAQTLYLIYFLCAMRRGACSLS